MPTFEITNAGNAKATTAETAGPRIEITTFKLSSSLAANDKTATSLPGTTLYTASVSTFTLFDKNAVQIVCEVAGDAGPFDYGSIGLYLADGTLYARGVYEELQHKTTLASSGYFETVRLRILLQLTQDAAAVFNFTVAGQNSVTEFPNLSYIAAPSTMETAPVVVVHEPTPDSQALVLARNDGNLWSPVGYACHGAFVATAADATHVTLAVLSTMPAPDTAGRYLLQSSDGQVRSVSAINGGAATVTRAFDPIPATGATVWLYEHRGTGAGVYEVATFADVPVPSAVKQPNVRVREDTNVQRSVMLRKSSVGTWIPEGYVEYVTHGGGVARVSSVEHIDGHTIVHLEQNPYIPWHQQYGFSPYNSRGGSVLIQNDVGQISRAIVGQTEQPSSYQPSGDAAVDRRMLGLPGNVTWISVNSLLSVWVDTSNAVKNASYSMLSTALDLWGDTSQATGGEVLVYEPSAIPGMQGGWRLTAGFKQAHDIKVAEKRFYLESTQLLNQAVTLPPGAYNVCLDYAINWEDFRSQPDTDFHSSRSLSVSANHTNFTFVPLDAVGPFVPGDNFPTAATVTGYQIGWQGGTRDYMRHIVRGILTIFGTEPQVVALHVGLPMHTGTMPPTYTIHTSTLSIDRSHTNGY